MRASHRCVKNYDPTTMKRLPFILFLLNVRPAFSADPAGEGAVILETEMLTTNSMAIKFTNKGKSSVRIFESANSWFWHSLFIRAVDVASGARYSLWRQAKYSKNSPDLMELKPNAALEIKIDFNDGTWPAVGRVNKELPEGRKTKLTVEWHAEFYAKKFPAVYSKLIRSNTLETGVFLNGITMW
jgi:hypothetical protein